jgi:hypothetical protein
VTAIVIDRDGQVILQIGPQPEPAEKPDESQPR